ncbi:hypothetical protein Tsubulata_022432 [Turnera subulata]|uniref:BZIP domain-containing protein n=1 Tax=Turnera subulata TaxID=218843 RepID=A0A9Q0FLR0_9ROSI|nr:hypothetical protein Tsubulata_022432 [Turnera subulata]
MSYVVKSPSGSNADAPCAVLDEKKRKRMISNRESARRSRMKRQKHMEDLLREKSTLERKIQEDKEKYIAIWQSWFLLDSENKLLRDQKRKLSDYFNYLHQILDKVQVSESAETNLEVHDLLFKTWKVPITASGSFMC